MQRIERRAGLLKVHLGHFFRLRSSSARITPRLTLTPGAAAAEN